MLIERQFGAIAWKYMCKESSVGCRLQVLVLDFFLSNGLLLFCDILCLQEALTDSEDFQPKVCYQMITDFQTFNRLNRLLDFFRVLDFQTSQLQNQPTELTIMILFACNNICIGIETLNGT